MNRLSKEKSAYLKHSASQKIEWYPWSEEPFEKARLEDKPIFLSSGAVWCHWCHVMAEECFYDDEIAGLLNDNFISIKLDRDERPDIDRRYQIAVAAMGSGGGWPLSVFLTPDKVPFFGGTYFPAEEKLGRPSFKKVLRAVDELYRRQKDDISEYTEKLMNALKTAPVLAGDINESLLDGEVTDMLSEFDPQNGGFGTAPKFPMPGALEFLLGRYVLSNNESAGYTVRKTLEAMALGGFYDQTGGGFHRYSTDKAWIIPHFEKMSDDNAWLLRNYINAYSVFGDGLFSEVAKGTLNFIRDVLSNPDGGFYVSQDADVTPADEGGYFTWTDDEFRKTLNDEEYKVLSLYWMNDAGAMHHDESKKVLFVAMGAEEIAGKTGKDVKEVSAIIKSGKSKLLKERNQRQTPFIDKTFYTSVNGMLISAFLLGYKVFKDDSLKEFALKSLEKIMKLRFIENRLFHTEGVKALLDDYAYIIDALISAYEVTGKASYLKQADGLMKLCMENLWDSEDGGFFDTDEHLLGMKIKGIEDIPHPSANSILIIQMLKLSFMINNDGYLRYAEKALKLFSSKAKNIGIHSGYYFCALDAFFNSVKLTLNTPASSDLSSAALSSPNPHKIIVYGDDKGYVVPCKKNVCYEPVSDSAALKSLLIKRNI
ncbi:MAG: thioredoxin domain-containing protein [Nitrospirae bacterium]|nr:thioredoxin domain-containing protein [Nitrospirota bacterium]